MHPAHYAWIFQRRKDILRLLLLESLQPQQFFLGQPVQIGRCLGQTSRKQLLTHRFSQSFYIHRITAAKWIKLLSICAGQLILGQRIAATSGSRTSSVPQEGQWVGSV